ncbi:MAG: glycosyltransferase family 4 protein [Candidatus Thorarchaeota archaeon]|jgi:glycosyltransferase involved in cell wall biosynthesis
MRGSARIKRLAIFVEHFPPYLGSDRSVFEHAKRIADTGVQIHFIVTQPLRYLIGRRSPDWEYTKNWSKPPPKVHKNVSAEYLLLGRRTMGLWYKFQPLAYLLTIIFFLIGAIKAVVRFNANVVIAAHASPIVGIVAFLSAKLTTKPLLIGCPDWMSAYVAALTNKSMNSLSPVITQLVEFNLYRWANCLFVVTEYLKKLLVSRGLDPKKIVVIPNGVDVALFNPKVDASEIRKKYQLTNRFVVLFSGHIEDWAGVNLIYDLAKCLNTEIPNSTILLVGAGTSKNKLLDRLNRSNLIHMVTYAGLHSYGEMPLFTAASDVALCLFPDSPVAHAASPLKLLEYLASGKAVVATRVAGTNEILDNNSGMFVAPGNTNDLCDAVVKLSNDNELRKTLGIGGRKRVEEKYSWNVLAQKLLDVCESLGT